MIAEGVRQARAVVVPHLHHPAPLPPLAGAMGRVEAVVLADVQRVTATNVIPPLGVAVRGTLAFVMVVGLPLLRLIPAPATPAQERAAITGVVLRVL